MIAQSFFSKTPLRDQLILFGITRDQISMKSLDVMDTMIGLQDARKKCIELAKGAQIGKQKAYRVLYIAISEKIRKCWREYLRFQHYLNILDKRIEIKGITEYDIERARQFDIVSLLESDTEVKKVGSHYVALCPFHHEDTPSCSVKDNHFFCFGCQEHGDTIDYCMKKYGLTFIEAVKKLI